MRQNTAADARFLAAAPALAASETFLDEAELAELLKVSRRTVQRWRVEGCGPRFRRHGARIRYALSDAMAWSEANSARSTSETRNDQV
jgi:phage terminase Nu1 subunit (DNA packaging protein)